MEDRLVLPGSRYHGVFLLAEKGQKIPRASPSSPRKGYSPSGQGFGRKGPSAHGNDMGMAVNPRFHDVAQARFPRGKGGFGRLPARYGPAPGIARCSGPFREVAVDVRREGGVEPFQSFFHQD